LEWYSEDDILLNEILKLEKKNKTKANNLAIDESIKLCKDLLKKHQKGYKDNFGKAKKIAEKLIGD